MRSKREQRWLSVAAVAAAGAVALTGCGSPSTAVGGAAAGTGSQGSTGEVDTNATMRVGATVATSLDPIAAPEAVRTLMSTWPVYDRLLQVTEDGQYAPMLATEWNFSDNGSTLDLKLREGVTFTDGTPFNGDAVKANIDRYRAAAGSASATATAAISSVDVVAPNEVKLRLSRPTTTILNTIAIPIGGAMISPKALGNADLATKPVGTGAYVLESFEPGQKITYKRRSDGKIWDTNAGKPAEVQIGAYAPDASNNAIRTGQLDVAQAGGGTTQLQSEIDSGKVIVRRQPTASTVSGMFLNSTIPALANIKVRQAINTALDRESLVAAFGEGQAARVQPFPSTLPGFYEAGEKSYAYDVDAAKKLLAEAGYPNGLDLGEFLVANNGRMPAQAQAVQAGLSEIGIQIGLRSVDILQLTTEYSKSNAPGMFTYMTSASLDPSAWFTWLYTSPLTLPGGTPEAMKPLLVGVDDSSLSDTQRKAKAEAVNKFSVENALYAPLMQGVTGMLITPKVGGTGTGNLPFTPFGVSDLRNVYITK
ncbi:hypothetical protein B2J88_02355 [Rhodococcus sp. SRB_17]|nr:hypothetical protein [Rhodococcus sp. SRB_17]